MAHVWLSWKLQERRDWLSSGNPKWICYSFQISVHVLVFGFSDFTDFAEVGCASRWLPKLAGEASWAWVGWVDGQADWPTGWPSQPPGTKKTINRQTNSFYQNGYDTASQFLYMCCFFLVSCFLVSRILSQWAVLLADCLSCLARPVGWVDGLVDWPTGWPCQPLKKEKK